MKININGHMSEHLLFIDKKTSLETALMKMRSRHIRHLLVADENEKIIGLVSDRDLLKSLSQEFHYVHEVMSTDLVTVDINDELEKVINLMVMKKMSAILITKKNEITGIITTEDMLLLLQGLIRNENNRPGLLEDFINYLQKSAQSSANTVYTFPLA